MNDDTIEQWLDWLRSGAVSPATLRLRYYTLRQFARLHPLDTATTDDVLAWLRARPSAASMATGLSALRSYYRWATLSGRLPADPTLMVRPVRVPVHDMLPVSKGALDRALILSPPKVRFALLLGARAGLRREEIASLHARHVGRDFLHITGKGGKSRRIPIHPDLRPYLDDLARADTWAFPSHVKPGEHVTPETICRWVSAALGGPWTTHSLRRRFAMSAYEGTHDLRAVQALLGHSSPATTARYIHADDDALTAAVLAVA